MSLIHFEGFSEFSLFFFFFFFWGGMEVVVRERDCCVAKC